MTETKDEKITRISQEAGAAYLADYLQQRRGRAKDLADAIGMDPSNLTRYKRGLFPIHVIDALKMERVTGGELVAVRLVPQHADELRAYKAR